jgi:hypothetical protein
MQLERRRATRHYFGGAAEVINIVSGKRLIASCNDLSVFGCFLKTSIVFPRGTNVKLEITHADMRLAVLGKVAQGEADKGMGVVFGAIEPEDQAVLNEWLAQAEEHEST